MAPSIAGTNFFKALVNVKGRDTLAPTLVANRVQSNKDPWHDEEGWEPAGKVLAALAQATPQMLFAQSAGTTGSYNLKNLQPWTAMMADSFGSQFGIGTVHGWRDAADEKYDPDGHPAGLALNFMTDDISDGDQVGDELAAHLRQNGAQLRVKYVIWQQHIATVGSDGTSTGCHLHFEIQHDGHPIEPRQFLGEQRVAI